MNITGFVVEVGGEQLNCALASPPKQLISERSGLLLNISATRQTGSGKEKLVLVCL